MVDNSKRTGAAIEAHYQFLLWLRPTVEKFPRDKKFTLGDCIQNQALDVLEALIEAITRDRIPLLRRANLGIEKLRFLLRLAADLTAVALSPCAILSGRIDDLLPIETKKRMPDSGIEGPVDKKLARQRLGDGDGL